MASEERKRPHQEEPSDSIASSGEPSKKATPPTNVIAIQKPLSYESLKIVLQYMDSDKRFQVSNYMPSIRRTEKIVPLQIDRLSFGEMSMTVNYTKYQLGVIRKFHDESDTTKEVKIKNQNGGAHYDLDRYGFHDKSMNAFITPGDIVFQYPDPVGPPKTKDDYQRRLDELEEQDRLDNIPIKRMPGWQPDDTSHEQFLLGCLLRDELPPYDSFIQLTITKLEDVGSDDEYSSDEDSSGYKYNNKEAYTNSVIQQAPYSFKLHKAFKNLTTNFLGNRTKPIRVGKLKFVTSRYTRHMVTARLPVGLQLQIDNLKLSANGADEDFRHPVLLSNTRKVTIAPSYVESVDEKLLCVHRNIHLEPEFTTSPWFDYVKLIKLWITMKREIGNCITETYYEKEYAMEVLEIVKNGGFTFRTQKNRMLLIPINNVSQIKMTVVEVGEEDEDYEDGWKVKLEVVRT